MTLFEQIASHSFLVQGFNNVQRNDGAAGIDNITIYDFEADLKNQIDQLHNELISFMYKPNALIMFERKKADGKIRLLSIPTVRDRVVQSSAYIVLEPIIDSEFEKISYAYRKGYSRESAARKINYLYRQGFEWIVDADISEFFNSVSHEILMNRFVQIISEKEVIRLIKNWLQCESILKNERKKITNGLPLGMPIVPMLANLYLDKFDEQLIEKGFKLVRYADDFIILTKTKPEAEYALHVSEDLLAELKLRLNPSKTKITDFKTGFKYLGYRFFQSLIVPSKSGDTSFPIPVDKTDIVTSELLKEEYNKDAMDKKSVKGYSQGKEESKLEKDFSEVGLAFIHALQKKTLTLDEFVKKLDFENKLREKTRTKIDDLEKFFEQDVLVDDVETVEPNEVSTTPEVKNAIVSLKHSLYIQEQGSFLKKEGNCIIVEKDGTELLQVPFLKVQQIILFGSCTISPAAMQSCLLYNIPIILLSSRGKYFGRIESTSADNAGLDRLQLLRSLDDNFALKFAKQIVTFKIQNNRVFLQRSIRRRDCLELSKTSEELKKIPKLIERSTSLDEVRGYEGRAAVIYFRTFGYLFEENSGFNQTRFQRTKHPPLDPINSLLSFGYTLLSANLFSFIRARGLNPYVGFLHGFKVGHPALASDLIEEFRNIIDSLVVQIINKHILKKRDFYFEKEPGTPCFLTNSARKEFINQFEIKMAQKTTHPETGFKVDYRRCLDLQVQHFVQVIRGEKDKYIPFKLTL